MSILQAPRTEAPVGSTTHLTGQLTGHLTGHLPYRCGDRIVATSPEGTRFRARIEAVEPAADDGQFKIVAAITEPRRYRSHLLTALVGADGYGPAVRPSR
jgi:hypothetical protein